MSTRARSLIGTLLILTGESQIEDSIIREIIDEIHKELSVLQAHLNGTQNPNEGFHKTISTLSELNTSLSCCNITEANEIVPKLNQLVELLG